MDRSGNGRGELGTLKVIVDDDIYQLSNVQNLPINFIVANPYLIDNLIPEFVNIIKYQAAYGKPTVGIQTPNAIHSYLVKNKTNSVYEIEFNNAENIDKIYITDITGKELFVPINIENNKATIDLHALSSQMYIAIVNTAQELYTIKLSR